MTTGHPEAPRPLHRPSSSPQFIAQDDPAPPALRDHWLIHQPKAKLYVDFADFAFARLTPISALLNGGFARAFRLSPEDLG